MLRSFLTVGSGYVAHMLCLYGAIAAIGYLAFPEFVEFMELAPEQQRQVMEFDPSKAMPPAMFWSVVAVVTLASVVIGALAAWTAPFSPWAHSAFVAALLFVNYLQLATTDLPAKKSMTVIYMVAFPLAVVVGGRWMSRRSSPERPPPADV